MRTTKAQLMLQIRSLTMHAARPCVFVTAAQEVKLRDLQHFIPVHQYGWAVAGANEIGCIATRGGPRFFSKQLPRWNPYLWT